MVNDRIKDLIKAKKLLETLMDKIEDLTEGQYRSSVQEIIDSVDEELEVFKESLKEPE